MALARADSGGALFSGPVVVLADKDKEEMDELVSWIHLATITMSLSNKHYLTQFWGPDIGGRLPFSGLKGFLSF